ncbi:E3 ubiquitin-protein ligase rnf8 isoform X2 [Coregonus clupeaformis]|uniref:E3 ubiquitin-protein ligase rnf8 isoform X2 n=1 Tax=Coregonus clupeaformis TaxID=59861 RepID=UPI001E1C8E6B|nr:E3 ubiquitin-protein ligase rnf8 isoform X2 [Coregonus clupeaformis]
MDQIESSTSPTAEKDEYAKKEVWCLTRVGKDLDWLRLFENTEVTIGRGLNVTHQLVSPSCPLMISRLHCMFKQRDDGQWTVTDKKSLNGVWVNGERIPVDKAQLLMLGDSIKLGVPLVGTKVEHEYILIRQRLEDIKPYLAKGPSEVACTASRTKKTKRKLNSDELEPSTSFKSKLYLCSATDKPRERPGTREREEAGPSVQQGQRLESPPEGLSSPIRNLSNLQTQNMLVVRERMNDTQRRVEALEGERQQDDPHQEEQVRELQSQLELLRGQLHRMEMLERSISETEKLLEVQKTQHEEAGMKKQLEEMGLKTQLEEALQEQRKVIEELALSRQSFEDILKAKDKELEVTKEEKELARAQKEEVVTQMTEVLENELQCIICSELLIRAVTLNCAHSFCLHCIREWRKWKDECPICRQAILSQTRSLVLDNCIDRMVEQLSPDMKQSRLALIAQPEELMVIHDDDSCSSNSDLSMDSFSSVISLEESNHWGSSDDSDEDNDEV